MFAISHSRTNPFNRQRNIVATPSTTAPGTAVTASATPHNKGSWTTIIATTDYDAYGFDLLVSGIATTGVDTATLIDIAVGPSQENVIFPEYPIGFRGTHNNGIVPLFIPLFIPKGSKVSARIQSAVVSQACRVNIELRSGEGAVSNDIYAQCDAYGADTTTSKGVAHTPGNSGVESTAANVGGTTSRIYRAVMLGVQPNSGTMSALAYHWELYVNSVTLAEWITSVLANETLHGLFPGMPAQLTIPAGSQLQIRGECSGTAGAHNVTFHCFY